ncbi:hypothetical protein ACIA6T_20380 [Streptomyces sp. NPDC051740]|uniref:hypothetical protein n=1 Tax=Streptomyces sp. NPDC051740 TaxID=3365673 RepID=UPI00378A7FFD
MGRLTVLALRTVMVALLGGAGLTILGIALVVPVLWMLPAQTVARDVEASRTRAEPAEVI